MSKVSKLLLSLTALLGFTHAVQAQNDGSFRDFYNQRVSEFKDWRSKANSEFTEYLSAAWEEFLVQRGKEDPVGPVPEEPVYYDPQEAAAGGAMHGFPSPGLMSVPAYPIPVPAVAASYSGGEDVQVDFFGIEASVPFAASMRIPRIQATEQDASNAWEGTVRFGLHGYGRCIGVDP